MPKHNTDQGCLSSYLLDTTLVCIEELSAGRWAPDSPRFADLRHVYSRLTGAGIEKFPRALDEVQRADPIARFFRWVGTQGRTPEMQFVSAGLRYLEDLERKDGEDVLFCRLFWQVIKVRSLYYRYIVQRPLKPGLQWFIRTYGRLKRGRRPISEELLTESAARLTGLNEGLRSLELRVSPEESTSEMLKSIVDIDRAFTEVVKKGAGHTAGTPQIGLVFHFTKDRGAGAKEGRPRANGVESEADPRSGPNPSGYRYAAFYNRKKAEAQSLVSLLTHYPLSLEIIRGIDTATDELGIPNWVLVPLYRYVRAAGRSAARVLSQRWNITAAPLRATAHVGEDYVHLLTGLRNVEEAVRYLDLKEGDRIGHGMSLGTDPHDWCERTERVLMAYEDRLFDLVWEWSWYSQEHIQPPLGRGLLVEREIARLSEHIYGEPIAPYRFEAFIDKLHDEQWLKRMGFPNGPFPAEYGLGRGDVSSSEGLLRLYLTDGAVFARGRRLMIVDPSFESEALAALQAGVRRKLCEKGVTVEVNPSSNLLIGDLGDIRKHPLWRMSSPNQDDDLPPLSVCIGSDDPLTFATNLRQEYQLVHDALTLSGLSEEQARRWIERTRQVGLENRFTVPRTSGKNVKDFISLVDPDIAWPP